MKKREMLYIPIPIDDYKKIKKYSKELRLPINSFSRMLLIRGLKWFEKSFKPNWENNKEVDNDERGNNY